jgi:hypothetical protein
LLIKAKINYGIYSPEISHTNTTTTNNNNNTNESTGQNIMFQNNQVNHLNTGIFIFLSLNKQFLIILS